jgi:hypothetical protein
MMVIEGSSSSAQLTLSFSGFFVVPRGRLALSLNPLLLLFELLSMLLGLLVVLLGEGAVLGHLAAMRVDRLTQLLGLGCVSVRLLAVPRCLGSKPLLQKPPLLRAAPNVGDGTRECDQCDYD